MYPFVRMVWQFWRHRNDPPLGPTDTHVSQHICLPWDLDFWMELNNGRTLTIYDLGRLPMAKRMGLTDILRAKGWGLTMAGVHVRYRRRVRMFDRITMKSRAVCWDHRFMYLEQSMWKADGECASHALYRSALTGPNGIVAPHEALTAMGRDPTSPPMPDWVEAWVHADAKRPWPPMMDA